MDRLSDQRFVTNCFHPDLNAATMNLLVRLRRFIAGPLPTPAPSTDTAPPTDQPGEGQPCTWPTLLIKVVEAIVRTRRIVVRRSSSWPHLAWSRRGCERTAA